jgi:hypothetical protein
MSAMVAWLPPRSIPMAGRVIISRVRPNKVISECYEQNESLRATKQRNIIRFKPVMIIFLFFLFAFEKLSH